MQSDSSEKETALTSEGALDVNACIAQPESSEKAETEHPTQPPPESDHQQASVDRQGSAGGHCDVPRDSSEMEV